MVFKSKRDVEEHFKELCPPIAPEAVKDLLESIGWFIALWLQGKIGSKELNERLSQLDPIYGFRVAEDEIDLDEQKAVFELAIYRKCPYYMDLHYNLEVVAEVAFKIAPKKIKVSLWGADSTPTVEITPTRKQHTKKAV